MKHLLTISTGRSLSPAGSGSERHRRHSRRILGTGSVLRLVELVGWDDDNNDAIPAAAALRPVAKAGRLRYEI
jgi:hypothetical protein